MIDHVGLGVSDLEESKAFYQQALRCLHGITPHHSDTQDPFIRISFNRRTAPLSVSLRVTLK